MSTAAFVEGPKGVLAAWETKGQVLFGRIDPTTSKVTQTTSAPGTGDNRKHPTLAVNSRGECLLAWTEGTGWQRGGALAWQVYDANGQPTADRGWLQGGIPMWGLATAYAKPDGGFVIVH